MAFTRDEHLLISLKTAFPSKYLLQETTGQIHIADEADTVAADSMSANHLPYRWIGRQFLSFQLEFEFLELYIRIGRKQSLTSSVEVGNYLADKLVGHKQEELWALYIDNASHIIAEKKLFQGTLNRSVAHPREIFRWAVIYGCSGIFIAHNHPSGKLMPSSSDFELTEDLCQVAKMMKIDFLDHFIVGQGHYLSMREEKLV